MAAPASRLLSTGSLLVNGSFDENTSIAPSKFRTTPNTIYAGTLDEVTINGGAVAKREVSDGTLQVSNGFDEVSLASGSVAFNGTSQYLTVPGSASNAAFNVGTGDWTIEGWLKFSSVGSGEMDFFESQTTNTPRILKRGSAAGLSFDYYAGSLASQLFIADASIVVGAWYHIAVARSSGTTKGFVNGVQAFSVADTVTGATPTAVYSLAGRATGVNFFPGSISNFRFVKGTAVYTAAFTPPQSILPSIANTQLLLNVTDSANFIKDNSPNAFTITNNGTATWNTASPFNS
jgi:Concanavalin A-like lectin/glucanases superfamily